MTAPEPAERSVEPRTVPEGRRRAKERVRAVQRAAGAIPAEGYQRQTRNGLVHIERVEFGKDGEVEWVDVHLAGVVSGGDPHFRLINPPALVPDPAGPIEVNGTRFRRDPMAALAEIVGQYGGAQAERKGHR